MFLREKRQVCLNGFVFSVGMEMMAGQIASLTCSPSQSLAPTAHGHRENDY